MTIDSTSLVKVRIAAGAAAAALAFAAAPQASASAAAKSVHGFTSTGMEFINSDNSVLAECGNQFSGRVTADDGGGEVKAAIDNFIVSCNDGTRVTPNALPWTLDLLKDRGYTIDGVDLNITTSKGTCRYTGTVNGVMEFPDGVYDLRGSLTRRSGTCGGSETLNVSALTEVINTGN
ncbi:hypothetical protein OG555_04705 [Kribbella sp. NBC_01484]|uniref:hypothetical protein n=1 Tax=Kribbella sp. NBC_01484 TaxID=2903579 RepID=UPI002E349080|nr:hypothetical protein [Kribbella sp. NBC_01484]